MDLKIKVTKEILKKSMYCYDDVGINCAIAVAIRDILPEAYVKSRSICFLLKKGIIDLNNIIDLDENTEKFILQFDTSTPIQRTQMEEYEFTIKIPKDIINSINIEDLKNCKTIELVNE